MKKTTLTATLPDGNIATRTTARSYSHVIAFRWDVAAERASIEADPMAQTAKNYRYYSEVLAAGVGAMHGNWPVSQHAYDSAVAALYGVASEQQYITKERQRRLDNLAKKHNGADVSGWMVEGWAGRLDLAQKAATQAQNRYRFILDVQVIPVNDAH